MITKALKTISVYLLVYFLISLICGIFKSEFFLAHTDNSLLPLNRLSNYITIIFSISAVIIYLIGILSVSYFIFLLLGSKIEYNVYTISAKYFVLFYGVNELVKTILVIYSFNIDANYIIDSIDSFTVLMEKNNWINKSNMVDIITFLLSVLLYASVLKMRSKNIALLDIIIVVLFMTSIFVITHRGFFDF